MSASGDTARKIVAGLDQGTTGTTAILVDENETLLGRGYREISQSYPAPGWVQHDPEQLWSSVCQALSDARVAAGGVAIAAIGITNQRETTILWDRATGRPVAPAIVWQDRRTADICAGLKQAGHEDLFRRTTGLLLDPYFSGTKIAWLLDNTPGLRARAERGEIAFGTVDSFLVWRLTDGQRHITDVSNACRTLLFDLHSRAWSDRLCEILRVPRALLPEVCWSAGRLAQTRNVPGIEDGTPISGMAGDQQAALFGQGCEQSGDAKCTFGTGSFLLMNVGRAPVISQHQLVGTVAWTVDGATSYALEGSAFISGALVQWLRDGLGLIKHAAEIEPLARRVPDSGGVCIVPAMAGLGAPHWRPDARGLISGITRGTTAAHIARAALEAMALQNVELVRAMEADAGRSVTALRVDGGAASNNLLMQLQADLLGIDIIRPAFVELTALGAARLAAIGAGLQTPWRQRLRATSDRDGDGNGTHFHPTMGQSQRQDMLLRWQAAVAKA